MRACGAPPIALRSSATQNEPPQGTACREAPAVVFAPHNHGWSKGLSGCAGARLCGAEKRRAPGLRAQRALSTDLGGSV